MESSQFESVTPIKPICGYIGGKQRLAKRICPYIDAIDHQAFVEPFFGMGGVFFSRTKKPKFEIINDINSEIINLFRMAKRHPDYLCAEVALLLNSRAEFNRLLNTKPEIMTELERAVRTLYLLKLAYGAKFARPVCPSWRTRNMTFTAEKIKKHLDNLSKRLQQVMIECLPYQKCIERYDRESTLFYIDPPYYQRENLYGDGLFKREDFHKLACLLGSIKGRFMLSLNDLPAVREIFKDFKIETIDTDYSLGVRRGAKVKKVQELLIRN